MQSISIIIPVFNEEKQLPIAINALKKNIANPLFLEIIVVDGGSSDQTAKIAKELGCKIVLAPKGRAKQMNAGALVANSEIFYFLHVDTIPPLHFDSKIRNSVANNIASGCFRLRFDSSHFWFRVIAWPTRFDLNICRGGDQSLFVSKAIWQKVGGFNEDLICFEDHAILPKLQSYGPFRVLPYTVITSARRYMINGQYRLQIIFICLKVLYYSRLATPKQLIQLYKKWVKG